MLLNMTITSYECRWLYRHVTDTANSWQQLIDQTVPAETGAVVTYTTS